MATPSTLFRVAAVASLGLITSAVASAAPVPPAAAPPGAGLPPAPIPYARLAPAPAPAAAAATIPLKPVARRRREVVTPQMAAVRAANAAALTSPAPNAFVGANLAYDYEVGRLYRIDASPRFLTTIMLRPGEHLISKAAGDTVRWTLGETSQGSGDKAQVELVLKTVRGGQRTNLVLTTDQRTYFLEAVSHDEPIYTTSISWNYPLDDMREAQAAAAQAKFIAAATAAARAAPVVEASLPIDRLNFGYRIEHPKAKRAPPWEPSRVFDDGSKTYLQFPATMGSSAAPPLFLVGPGGQAELVNYRVKGDYYIVDRLIDVAELRLGEKPQTIVRITRTGSRG